MTKDFSYCIKQAVQCIRSHYKEELNTAVILGSGLGDAVNFVQGTHIPFSDIDGFPMATIQGHKNILKLAQGKAFMLGRFHYYEGHSPEELILPLFVLHKLGVENIIVTNAAGSLRKRIKPGDIVMIKDHINLLGQSLLRGQHVEDFGPGFTDMHNAYSKELIRAAKKLCKEIKAEVVYACMPGPQYETEAEAKMLRRLGADVVGMSTVPEVIAARFLKMRVVGISCITNFTAGVGKALLNHADILRISKVLCFTLSEILKKLLKFLDKKDS
jgi:purine-nucleoside phosphorylase